MLVYVHVSFPAAVVVACPLMVHMLRILAEVQNALQVQLYQVEKGVKLNVGQGIIIVILEQTYIHVQPMAKGQTQR